MKIPSIILACFLATQLTAQNAVDTTFDPGTGANAFIESVVVQPDEKILVCGAFTSINGTPRSYVARLNSDGSVDPTFVASPNNWVRFMALQPDNKIVIGGFFTGVDGASRHRVARLNENGSLDPTFNPGTGCTGRMVDADPTAPFLFAIAVQNNGKIIIGGNFTNYNGIARNGVARLNNDGSLDNTFNVGAGVNSWVRSILILPNEQILLSGWFENYNHQGFNRMVRLNPDGSADQVFKPWFGYSTSVYSMSRQSDGKIVVGGHSVNTNAPFQQEVVRLLSDGTFDPTFNPGGAGADDKVESVVVQPDDKILIGGYFAFYNNVRVRGFARLNSNGTIDPTLNASADNWIWTLALQNDGKILMCGAFDKINDVPRKAIARLNPSDDYLPPPPPPPPPPPVEPDSIAPTVRINSPVARSRVFSSQIVGEAHDNVEVAEVLVRVGTGEFLPAIGTTNWSFTANLKSGNNTVDVKSVDAAGNQSALSSVTFSYVPGAAALSLEVLGPGSTTLTNGQFLQLTRNYTITAKPSGENIFGGWTGSVTSSAPTLRFVMQPDFALQATFGTNPFPTVSGVYNGIFSNSNGVVPATAGFLTINLKNTGKFSGTILLEGGRSPLSGQFDLDGRMQKNISRGTKPPLNVDLQLDFAGGLSGIIAVNGESSILSAERAQTSVNSNKSKYTLLIPPGGDAATVLGGYGFGSATVDGKGKVNFRGALADGTTVMQNTIVSQNARWPFYASLYRGKGVVVGWLTLTDEPDSDLRGENVAWTKLPGAGGKFYPNGFTNNGTAIGSLYVAPARGTPPVNWTNGIIEFAGGNLTGSITNAATLGNNNKFVIASTNKTVLNIVNASGLLNGNFIHPITKKRTQLKGALLQKQQMGAGIFPGTNESGSFHIHPMP